MFPGNYDRHTVVTNILNPPIAEARFVKILPQEWERTVTLRFEILGCKSEGKSKFLEYNISGTFIGGFAEYISMNVYFQSMYVW